MAYTTQNELNDAAGGAARFIELADFDGDGVADAAMVARAQAAADGFIDQYLRSGTLTSEDLARLRLTPTDTIRRIAADETIFRLREQRRQIGEDDRKSQELRREELRAMDAGHLRVDDRRTARAATVVNEGDVSRETLKGQW